MKNLLIFGIYGFKDGYYALGKYFSKYFDSVSFFPLYEYVNYLNSNLKNYYDDIEKIINGDNITNVYSPNLINQNQKKTHIILWYNFEFLLSYKINGILFYDIIVNLKNKYNFEIIIINWDPDNNTLKNVKIIENILIESKNIFVSNPNFLKFDNSKIKFFKAGFCPNSSFYDLDNNFKCDVSIICTNLYDKNFPNTTFTRKHVLDILYNNNDINLHIYGTENIKNIYPNKYKGYISYDNCYKVFSNSLINLNISPLNNDDIESNSFYYYSERLPQIIGCNGVMLSNNDFGNFLVPNEDYIYVNDINRILEIIKYYLKNPDKLEIIKNNIEKKKNYFNYEIISEEISNIILS